MANRFMFKLRRAYQFLTLLTVEPYMFAFFFLMTLKQTPTTQLIQDKICLFHFNLNETYCHELPHMTYEQDTLHRKSDVLTEANNYAIYMALFMTIPGFVAGLFVGPWLDVYLKAKKYLLIAGALAGICETIILLLNVYYYSFTQYGIILTYIAPALVGGIMAIFTSIFSYSTSTTPMRLLALRMAVGEVLNAVAQPLGTYLGGRVLNTKPLLDGGQLYNYTAIYAIAGLVNVLMLIWTIFMIDERRDTIEWHKRFGEEVPEDDSVSDSKVVLPTDKLRRFESFQHVHPLKLLFRWNNVREMFRTCFKRRPGTIRLQIWLLMFSMTCFMLSHIGPYIFLYSFAQKVYNWNSEDYSNASVAEKVITTIATFIAAPILIKVLNLRDATLTMIGCLAYLAQNLIRGLVLKPSGFFISIAPGCLGSMGGIGLRTYFSKLVSVKEQGKVFSLLSTVDAIIPLVSVVLFTQIFNATMNTNPGLSFIIVASFNVFPILVFIWVYFYAKLPNLSEEVIVNDGEIDHTIDDKSREDNLSAI